MGAVTFSLDKKLIQMLSQALPLDVFIETGTFNGDTVADIDSFFKKIYTIELSDEYYQKAFARFKNNLAISVIHGDSAKLISDIAVKETERSIVYWLDAHWCVAANTAGEKSQCPLLEEIAAIGSLNKNSVVIIDDARLFLAPPPKPHEVSHWPSFNNIVIALQKLSSRHHLMILNDNIILYPEKISTQLSTHAQENGVDWLMHFTHDQDALYKQLVEKEAVIESYRKAHKERVHLIVDVITQLGDRFGNGMIKFIKKKLVPRLGRLYQHDPVALKIPCTYYTEKKLPEPPKISIVTPSYNQAAFLEKTISSVIQQEYSNLEFIVQDGGSTDHSVDVIKKFEKYIHHWESRKDNGQSHAINLGFQHATGGIMAYLNSDDILLPGALNCVAHYFKSHPKVDVIYGNRIVINENDDEIGRWVLPKHSNKILDWVDFIPQETLFWRRRIWDRAGGKIDEHFQFAMDWDLLLRFKEARARFVRIPRFLGAFRVHLQQKTAAQINLTGIREMDELRFRIHKHAVSYMEIKKRTIPYLIKHLVHQKKNALLNMFRRQKTLTNKS